jgi:anti-sigma regulatory factor (Ser/Thr protein kinase)
MAAAENAVDRSATRSFGLSRGDVARIDDWLEQVGADWGTNERAMFGARLCVAELAANAVEHGGAQSSAGRMVVTVRGTADGIEVEFCDTSGPFDPTVKPQRANATTLAAAAPSGRGLELLHAYGRKLAYVRDGSYNRVTLTVPRSDG